MFHKLTEEREIQIAADREKAKAGFRLIGRVLKWIALLVLGSFLYFAGEKAGLESCQAWQAIMRPEVTSAP